MWASHSMGPQKRGGVLGQGVCIQCTAHIPQKCGRAGRSRLEVVGAETSTSGSRLDIRDMVVHGESGKKPPPARVWRRGR